MSSLSSVDKQLIISNVPKVTADLESILPSINPLLVDTLKKDDLVQWVDAFTMLVMLDNLDEMQAIHLGEQLEIIDSFQVDDLLKVVDVVQHALLHNLSHKVQLAVYPQLLSVFIGLIAGFYIGKARRAAAINMSAASRMGHDLKTPINAITGFSHVILKEIDGPITQFQKEDLTSIYEAGKKLLTMINDLTALMKQDARRIGIYPAKFMVSDLVTEIMANFHPLCASAGHTLLFKLERDLGVIQGDASKIRWILMSLLLYLAHCGSEWDISLAATRHELSEQDMVAFRIEGYPSDAPMLNNTNENQISSTQIINREVGLATCWRFCTSMGGSLMMFEGQAVVFDVCIPAESPADNGL